MTTGDMHAYSDCQYVTKGFNAKRYEKPSGSNMDLWFAIGQVLMKRRGLVSVSWTKAHVTPQDVLCHEIPPHCIAGNAFADELAKRGAALHAVPHDATLQIQARGEVSRKVGGRLVSINRHMIEHHPRERPDGPSEPKARRAKFNLVAAVKDSGHKLAKLGGMWACRQCGQRASFSRLRKFLCSGSCSASLAPHDLIVDRPAKPTAEASTQVGTRSIHPSHYTATYAGRWWCWKCAATGTTYARGLIRPCLGAPSSNAGREALSRLRRGLPPKAGQAWPETGAAYPTPQRSLA